MIFSLDKTRYNSLDDIFNVHQDCLLHHCNRFVIIGNLLQIDLQRFYTITQCTKYDRKHVYLVTGTSLSRFKRKLSVLFAPMLFCCGHTMSQTQIFLSVFSFKIKSGFLAVVVFRMWNLKSHTSFALLFFSTVLLSHRCSYQMAS